MGFFVNFSNFLYGRTILIEFCHDTNLKLTFSNLSILDSPSTSGGLKKSTPHTMSTLHEEQHSESENEGDREKSRQIKADKECKVQVELQAPKSEEKKVANEQQVKICPIFIFTKYCICQSGGTKAS